MGCLTDTGRVLFFAALITQTVMFAQYPSIYFGNELYNCLILLAVPTLVAWIVVLAICDETEQLQCLWIVWGSYVSTLLIPMVGIIYGGLRESLDRNQFFGPNILMMTTCGSPAIALLLLTTAKDVSEDDDEDNIGLFSQLCGNIVLDLFDDMEILDILLSQNEKFHLSSSLQVSIVVFVCISLLLSTLDMAEKKYDEVDGKVKNRKKTYFIRLVLQMFLVNVPLLVIRLKVWLDYKHNASVFIAKNVIMIVISTINIFRLIGKNCCS